jgi:hypothetical protein
MKPLVFTSGSAPQYGSSFCYGYSLRQDESRRRSVSVTDEKPARDSAGRCDPVE